MNTSLHQLHLSHIETTPQPHLQPIDQSVIELSFLQNSITSHECILVIDEYLNRFTYHPIAPQLLKTKNQAISLQILPQAV